MTKFALASEHRDFYRKHQYIEFEGCLSEAQRQALNDAIDQVLARRLGILKRQLTTQSSAALYQAGRDVWRSSDSVRKVITQEQWARIATELVETKNVRLGCDQLFLSFASDAYTELFSHVQTLEEMICLQGVLGGLMLCLEEPEEIVKAPFAQQAGNALFFSSTTPLDLSGRCGKQLLIVYTRPTAVYVRKQTDPNEHLLKQWGYALGDKLIDKWNPLLGSVK